MSRPRAAAALLAAAAAVLSGCGPADPPPAPETSAPTATAPATPSAAAGPVRIATGPTEQTAVLAHLYAGRLREAGFDASVVDTGTDRDAYLGALERGEVELVPDHSGNLYLHLRGLEPVGPATPAPTGTPAPTPTPARGGLAEDLSELLGLGGEGADNDDVLAGVRDVLPEGLRILEPAPAENTVAVVVTRATAVEHSLEDLADLGPICAGIALGADPDFADRPYGIEGLAEAYECVPEDVVPFGSAEELVTALLEDEVQAAALFTASPEIEDNALVVLGDPLNNFVPQRVVPVADEDLPEAAADVVDEVSAGIGTEDLVLMTRMTTARDPYRPEEAARYWLEGGDDT
ncbi:glycine/betaine ABC transporter permease [Kocuria dechangensis]|uniref:Glycine/betaine ABC transporter permease n=1 Tax=Kocuria dechangensis TaxID=1176249 RepID=A0A917GM20_9MICC|nr:glycine betaine ABC transporter substrate-binding protein [Kocuria dechangensis]GGG50896.1 glycine/betaine ABC transporter permease [Kocuria dechangensis]